MKISIKNCKNAGAGIRTLVDLRQQVLSLSPLASRAPPLMKTKDTKKPLKILTIIKNAPAGIRTRVFGSKGRNDWPDYTTGANTYDMLNAPLIKNRFINGAGAEIRTRVPGSTVPEDDHLPYPGK